MASPESFDAGTVGAFIAATLTLLLGRWVKSYWTKKWENLENFVEPGVAPQATVKALLEKIAEATDLRAEFAEKLREVRHEWFGKLQQQIAGNERHFRETANQVREMEKRIDRNFKEIFDRLREVELELARQGGRSPRR